MAKVFAEAIGAGDGPSGTTSTWDYHVQAIMGDVVGDDNKVDFQDSYEIMAYLQSVTTGNTNRITQEGATYDKWGIEGTYGDNTQSSMFLNTFTLTDTNQSSKTINVAHGLVGDVNFTHSYEPSAEGAAKSTQASARNSMGVQYSSVQGADPLYKSEEANLDLVSEIKDDGTVEFTIEMDVENLIGTQFNVKYNTTVLTLDNVIFDTGNEMTNFSNIDGDKIRIGSFDQNFNATVKTGTPYKLIFTPNEAIQNTSGLITFKVTEGVKDDGTQVNFIIN